MRKKLAIAGALALVCLAIAYHQKIGVAILFWMFGIPI